MSDFTHRSTFAEAEEDLLPNDLSCCRCHRTVQSYFYLPVGRYCAACCDGLDIQELLFVTEAQSVSDLLYDLGFTQYR